MMRAFHNDEAIKEKYLARVRAHRAADEIIKGQYWKDGKGCAIACTLHSSRHEDYEPELGIPRLLAHLEDKMFECMPNDKAKDWPIKFLEAINVGADLSLVWPRFAVWFLTDEEHGVIKFADEKGKRAIKGVAELFKRKLIGEEVSGQEWNIARKAAAYAGAYAADAASYAASYASSYADVASAAADASYYAAAAYAASGVDAYAYAVADARQQAFYIQSEMLLQMLSEAK